MIDEDHMAITTSPGLKHPSQDLLLSRHTGARKRDFRVVSVGNDYSLVAWAVDKEDANIIHLLKCHGKKTTEKEIVETSRE